MRIPLNEFSTKVFTDTGGYTEIGGGINYQKEDGTFEPSTATFIPSKRTGIDWECYTTYNRIGLKDNLNAGTYSVFTKLGNDGQILRSKPVGLAYLNTETKEWTMIAPLLDTIGSVSGNKILYKDAFKNCDLEYVILKDKLKQNVYIKSLDGFTKSPYSADKTMVVMVTKFDLDNFETPKIVDSRGEASLTTMKTSSATATNFGDETEEGELVFTKQRFGMTEATDAKGNIQKIKKRIIKHNGNYYLLEGLPYSWLATASYPVLLDYTTISSDITTQTWSSGTYYISTTVSIAENNTLTINSGVIVKFGSGVSINNDQMNINGTYDAPVYFTSFNDDSVGETISGSSGTPAAGDWGGITSRYWSTSGGSSTWTYIVGRYATIFYNYPYNVTYYAKVFTLTNFVITNCSSYGLLLHDVGFTTGSYISFGQILNCGTGIRAWDLNSRTIGKSILIKGCTTGVDTYYSTDPKLVNCTFDSNSGTAVGGAFQAENCIISNNGTDNSTSADLNYCLRYNNTNSNTPATNTNALTSANPNFATGTAVTGYIGNMTYFLNQSTSPCKDAGSDTAANLSLNTYTTSTDKTTDSGTVDIGYHYSPADVSVAATPTRFMSTNKGWF